MIKHSIWIHCDFCPMSKAYDISSELGPNLSMTNAWIPEGWTYIGKMIVCPDHKIEVDGIQMSDTNNK